MDSGGDRTSPFAETADSGARNDAIQALVALGYSASEAAAAVRKVKASEDMSVEDILKQSLKNV